MVVSSATTHGIGHAVRQVVARNNVLFDRETGAFGTRCIRQIPRQEKSRRVP